VWNKLCLSVCCAILVLTASSCGADKSSDFLTEGRKLMDAGNAAGAVVLFRNALEKTPADYTLHLELGRAYIALGKLDLAEGELQKCLRQQPDDPPLNLALGELYVARNEPAKALPHLARYEQGAGETAVSRELAGLAHAQARSPEEARAALERSIALDAKRVTPRLALARLFLYRGDLKRAVATVDEALAVAPEDRSALTLRGDLLLRQGDAPGALVVFRKVASLAPGDDYARYMSGLLALQTGDEAGAAAVAASMNKDFKDNSLTLMLDGALAAQRKDYTLAASLFQRSVAMRPSLEGYYKLGMALYGKGDLETALSQFNRVLEATPEYDAARRMTVTILLAQRRVAEARQEAQKLVERNPSDAAAHFMLASAQMAAGDRAGAERSFEAGLALQPAHVPALLQLSRLKQADGRPDEALEDLKAAVVAAPDDLAVRNALFAYHLGRGDTGKGVQVVLEGLRGTPQDAILYTMLVPVYVNMGDEAKALDAVAQAHRADPDFPDAYLAGLRLHAGAGRAEQALAESEAYLARKPDAPGFLLASGALLDLLGRTAEADARFDKALAANDPRVSFAVAERAVASGQDEKARRVLEEALRQHDQTTLRDALAIQLARMGKPDDALALYTAIETQRPREALLGRYRLLTHLDRHQEAADTARELGRRESASPLPVLLEAAAFERMGQRPQGVALLEAAHRKSGDPELLLAMGGMLERNGDEARAETCYRDALKARPDHVPTLLAYAGLDMRRKEYAKATALYEKAVSIAPDDVVALNNLAMAYLEKASRDATPQKALRLALQAYTRAPDNPAVLDTLGVCMMANGRADDAARAFGRAVVAVPGNPSLRYRHAEALFKAGRKDMAAEELRAALQTPDFPEAAKARDLLRKTGN